MEIMKTDRQEEREKERRRERARAPEEVKHIEYEREDRKKRDRGREARRSGRDRSCYLAAVWQRHQLADATVKTFSSGPAGPPRGRFLRRGKILNLEERNRERKRKKS